MTIQQAKHEVLNNNTAIEYDNGNIEMLRKVLIYVFPNDGDSFTVNGFYKYYWADETDEWNAACSKKQFKSIPISSITFDELTVESLIEFRKEFPNNLEFGDAFDKLINQFKLR